MRWNQLTLPRVQNSLAAVAAIIAMYGLLILPSLGMIKLQVDRGIALTALPIIILISLGVPAWLLLRYLRNHRVETGFYPEVNAVERIKVNICAHRGGVKLAHECG